MSQILAFTPVMGTEVLQPFRPSSLFPPQDYHHRLLFATESECFEVPVRAVGPRALLDFAEEYHLPTCVVKGSTESTHLVRNIGNSKANFSLQTQR